MTFKFLTVTAAAAIAATTAPVQAATLIGDEVTCGDEASLIDCNQTEATIGDGVEFTLTDSFGFSTLFADFDMDSLLLSSDSSIGFGGSASSTIIFENTTSAITSAVLTQSNSEGDFTQSDISLVDGVLRLELRGVRLSQSSNIGISLSTMAPVPEPSTWAMMIAGFAAVGFAMRRCKENEMSLRLA